MINKNLTECFFEEIIESILEQNNDSNPPFKIFKQQCGENLKVYHPHFEIRTVGLERLYTKEECKGIANMLLYKDDVISCSLELKDKFIGIYANPYEVIAKNTGDHTDYMSLVSENFQNKNINLQRYEVKRLSEDQRLMLEDRVHLGLSTKKLIKLITETRDEKNWVRFSFFNLQD